MTPPGVIVRETSRDRGAGRASLLSIHGRLTLVYTGMDSHEVKGATTAPSWPRRAMHISQVGMVCVGVCGCAWLDVLGFYFLHLFSLLICFSGKGVTDDQDTTMTLV
jgi:hypothetical protein